MDNKKLQRYEKIIVAQTTKVWQHLCSRVDTLPDLIDLTECSQQQIDLIKDVVAVEKEWILNNEARLECSLLQFTDDID